ncbi:MAG: hypothetical protein IPQ07_21850 [Myxococcales bacterium]|nr:hypothetical protein [Myxococcales bacterium]
MKPHLTGGFELRGTDAHETRLLVHPAFGYAIAVPGHARLVAPTAELPRYGAVLALADGPIEIGLRMDEVPTAIAPDAIAAALALAYARSRALDPDAIKGSALDGRVLARGADAGTRATYVLRGEDPQAMEFLALTTKAAAPIVHALHLTVRYRRTDLTPFAWASLRSALLNHQSWDPERLPSTTLWPASTMVAGSVSFELSAAATAEARAKAADIGTVTPEEVGRLADLLLGFAGTDDAPTMPMHAFVHELTSRQVAAAVPPRIAEVLVRNIADVASMHDLRAWSWQCFWAVGNRAELAKIN